MGHAWRMSAADFAAKQAKRSTNKFGARKKVVDGIEFDSTHEAERYQLLKLEERSGVVRNIRVHQPIQVDINGQHVFTYECDFVFQRHYTTVLIAGQDVPTSPGLWLTEYQDAKGYRKGSAYQLFRLKKNIIRAALGIEIEEV